MFFGNLFHNVKLILLIYVNIIFALQNNNNDNTIQIYKNCNGLNDGEYYFQLIEDYPIIRAKCSNGYIIIDYNYDNEVEQYFTSFQKWHYAMAGPLNDDSVNWEKWWRPSKDFTEKN